MSLAFFAGQPRGLYICFATELWERFSYYGMRALLIFYLTQHFLFSDEESYAIYGAYTALAWGLPVIGGILADRYIGQRKAVVIGALLLSAGHLLLAIEGPAAMPVMDGGARVVERSPLAVNLFFLSLALVATGVGFLKTNISTLVGALYAPEDRRRDAGFTIFYSGINLGAVLAPLLCGWLGQRYGWSYGFGAAGIGMLIGLLTFLKGQRHFGEQGLSPAVSTARVTGSARRGSMVAWSIALVLVIASWFALSNPGSMGTTLGIGSALLATAILRFTFVGCTPVERGRLLVVMILVMFAILFWSLYEQIGSSLNLFMDRLVDRGLLGAEIEASQLQALPAAFVILLAPLFSAMWTALAAKGRTPGTAVQFSVGLLSIGLAFLMPLIGAMLGEPGTKLSLAWPVMLIFLMVCGELCISPIAMSMITRLCPKRVMGMMMGSFLLSLSIGSFLAGLLAGFIRVEVSDGRLVDPSHAMSAYTEMFASFALVALLAAAALFAMAPGLSRRLHAQESPAAARATTSGGRA